MRKLKSFIQSPYVIFLFFGVKMITYYGLIGVAVWKNPLVLGTIAVLTVLFLGIAKTKWKYKRAIFFITYTFFSIVMFADSMYYNYYNQTVSIQQVWQVANVAKVPSSFVATLIPASIFLIIDIPFVCYYFKDVIENHGFSRIGNKGQSWANAICIFIILVLAVNPLDSILMKKINSVGFFSNHIRDIIEVTADTFSTRTTLSKEEVLATVNTQVTEKPSKERLKGIAEGKNLIVIQLEAFQNFVIGAQYHGQEITPNLNQLLQKDTLYFDKYYSVIGKGNTADAEFATLNSLYPVIDGESYRLFTQNTYDGLPWLLKEKGYSTLAVHGYEGKFWNREEAYPFQGIDNFYSMEDLEQNDIVGLGISDKSMFHQTVEILKKQKSPYFLFDITLTSHHPYELPGELCEIQLAEEDKNTKFGKYLQSVHYTDAAIGQFIAELKEEGLYNDTVIALYGDHHGLNWTMDGNEEIVGNYLGKQYDYDEMLKVPLMIHIPDSGVKQTISTLGCQVDFLPTISNLMNLKINHPYTMGQDLLNAKDGFAAFTAYLFEGSFAYNDVMFEISREGIFEGSRAYDMDTHKALKISKYKKQYKRAIDLKQASREILEQDLIADYVQGRGSAVEKDKAGKEE